MADKKRLKELYVLRSIACLSIVFLHSIGPGLESLDRKSVGEYTFYFFDSLKVFLYYGTPLFVFMSELILAQSYKGHKLPEDFLKKRVNYILIPYIFMAFFYSIPYASSVESWGIKFLLNVFIGDFHGYFILIIFQFYILHMLFHRYFMKWNPSVVITISLIINACYLALFNFFQPMNIPYGEYVWNRFSWVPFFGWVFYFSLGYYCGYYYKSFTKLLNKYNAFVSMGPVLSSLLLLYLYHSGIVTTHSSKRIDILLHTTTIGFFIIYAAHRLNSLPKLFVWISQYSFGIYLLHMFYIWLVEYIFSGFFIKMGVIYISFLFLVSTVSSMMTIYYLNKWEYGKFMVGKIGTGYPEIPPLRFDPPRLIKKAYHYLF